VLNLGKHHLHPSASTFISNSRAFFSVNQTLFFLLILPNPHDTCLFFRLCTSLLRLLRMYEYPQKIIHFSFNVSFIIVLFRLLMVLLEDTLRKNLNRGGCRLYTPPPPPAVQKRLSMFGVQAVSRCSTGRMFVCPCCELAGR
jgi:hypothetical protein